MHIILFNSITSEPLEIVKIKLIFFFYKILALFY